MIRTRWLRREALLPLVLSGTLLLGACSSVSLPWSSKAATTPQTTTVQLGTVETTINATGTAKAVGDVSLSLESGGAITEVLVKVGERVTAGQPLVRADTHALALDLQQAEANLASAQATYEATKAGATEKEIAQAQAAVDQAVAKARQTATGTTTAQDIANAEAALRSAQAKLEATIAGTTTAQDIASAEAALRSAEAKLAQTQVGATTSEIASAQQSLAQAQASRRQQESQLSLSKEQARLAVEQAANDLRAAQEKYGAAKLIWDEAERTGKDPTIAEQKNPTNKSYRDLTDAKRRQYKADFEAAELAMRNAEQALEQKQIAYEESKKQEISGLQQADSQIVAAQAKLDEVLTGPDPQDVTQAQAAVDQARASLEKLTAPAKATDVAQAQAAVDQASASLAKLRSPVDANDIAQAQASVTSAQAALTELQAGPTSSDLAAALATVKQAEVTRDLAQTQLNEATLTAPFAGVVAAVNAMVGQQVSASTTGLITLVDDSTLSIDVNIAEADIAKVQIDQPARATFTALPNVTIPGTVAGVSPKATVSSNVVSYVATVALDNEARTMVKTGMTATVNIVTASKADVLFVPSKAIHTQNQQKVVSVLFKGEQFSTPVQVGLVGDSTTEIVSGLAAGDTVVTSTTSATSTSSSSTTTRTSTGGLAIPGAGGPPPR
jgi:HlyD family secretion protein